MEPAISSVRSTLFIEYPNKKVRLHRSPLNKGRRYCIRHQSAQTHPDITMLVYPLFVARKEGCWWIDNHLSLVITLFPPKAKRCGPAKRRPGELSINTWLRYEHPVYRNM
jgi:G:T-mismatch repair DNA endonuclease (very short patch repair protein)